MIGNEIRDELYRLQDIGYREFQIRLLPTVPPETVIGVRTPALRALAKTLAKREDAGEFLKTLPHAFFDENQLHAFMISGIRDFRTCLEAVCRFLPYIDNWATCDQLSPRVFKKHRPELLPYIRQWLSSRETYTVRFAVGTLMEHFLEEDFDPAYLAEVAALRSGEYYINMMIAWYFATALAKQYEAALPYLRDRRLAPWTHNKTIQKATESCRITPEQKAYLRTLRIPGSRN